MISPPVIISPRTSVAGWRTKKIVMAARITAPAIVLGTGLDASGDFAEELFMRWFEKYYATALVLPSSTRVLSRG